MNKFFLSFLLLIYSCGTTKHYSKLSSLTGELYRSNYAIISITSSRESNVLTELNLLYSKQGRIIIHSIVKNFSETIRDTTFTLDSIQKSVVDKFAYNLADGTVPKGIIISGTSIEYEILLADGKKNNQSGNSYYSLLETLTGESFKKEDSMRKILKPLKKK